MKSVFNAGLIDCGSDKVPRLASMLQDCGCSLRIIPLAEANGAGFAGLGALVVSGGPQLFTDEGGEEMLARQFEFLDALSIPVLGICLGHQALAVRRGARAYLGVERRGSELIEVKAEHQLFRGLPRRISMEADHCEGVPLPEGFRLLASSVHFEVEAMASETHPHFGVQFHPEASGEVGEVVIRNFCDMARASQRG